MTAWTRQAGVVAAILCAAVAGCRVVHERASGGDSNDRTVFSHPLPRMNGDHLNVQVVEVTYGPGGSSPAHSHPCPVFGYILEGTYRTQVKGEREATYKAGESFYEAPDGVHLVSANASDSEPVRFLAAFICDHETPLSTAVPETEAPRGTKP